MRLIHGPVVDLNVASYIGGSLAGPSRTSGHIILLVVPSAGPLPHNIIARCPQPLEDEEMEEGIEQRAGLVAISLPLLDKEVIEVSAEEVAQ